MMNRILFYLALITFSANLSDLLGQNLEDSLYNIIPLEVYEGFEHDTITLPGESEPRQVFKVGVYQSNVKIYLDEVGEVFVHHVIAFMEEGHPYMEIYSRQPSSEFIQGIRRYGHYRMYSRQSVNAPDRYNGNPRVEFVNGLNTIVRSINPRKIFNISAGKEMLWVEDVGDQVNVSFYVEDCRKYLDTLLYDSLAYGQYGPDCSFAGWIQYVLEGGLLKVDLHAGIGSEEPAVLYTFEAVIYNSLGQLVGRVSEPGPVNSIYLTVDHKYVYMNGGGALTEDFVAPYTFKIKELKTGEVLFERRSTQVIPDGGTITGTNLGIFKVRPTHGPLPYYEAYVIDHDRNIMYLIHNNPLCQSSHTAWFQKDYCECRSTNGLKVKLYYDKDFTAVTFNKK